MLKMPIEGYLGTMVVDGKNFEAVAVLKLQLMESSCRFNAWYWRKIRNEDKACIKDEVEQIFREH